MRKQKPLKPLIQEEFKMNIVKDLGMKKPTENYYKKVRMALFECTMCNEYFEAVVTTKAKNQLYCKNCNGTCLKKDNRDHPLYRTWATTKNKVKRTDQESTKAIYYDRNITMCKEWEESFDAFFDWAINNGWEEGLTIDRKDNFKGYSPDNCRWVDYSTQNANQRRENTGVTDYVGVQVSGNTYRAVIRWRNVSYGLGSSKDQLHLAKMYDSFIQKYNLPHTPNGVLSEGEYVAPTSKNILQKLTDHPIIL